MVQKEQKKKNSKEDQSVLHLKPEGDYGTKIQTKKSSADVQSA